MNEQPRSEEPRSEELRSEELRSEQQRYEEERMPETESRTTAREPIRREEAGSVFPELDEYRRRFDSLQSEFIDEPRAAVHKAESLIEEAVDSLMHSLRERLRQIHDEAGSDGDTERMRVAMRSYREVIHSLGGEAR